MPNTAFSESVLRHLTDNEGVAVYANDIAKDLGVTRQQVMSCIRNTIMRKHPARVEQLASGVYRWHTNPTPTHADNGRVLYERVGTTKSGNLVLEDEEGNILVVKELD